MQQTHAPAKRSKVTGELLATPGMELHQPLAMPGQPWTLIWVSEQAYKIVLERPSDSPPLSMNIPYTIVETFDAAVVALQESAASSDFL